MQDGEHDPNFVTGVCGQFRSCTSAYSNLTLALNPNPSSNPNPNPNRNQQQPTGGLEAAATVATVRDTVTACRGDRAAPQRVLLAFCQRKRGGRKAASTDKQTYLYVMNFVAYSCI